MSEPFFPKDQHHKNYYDRGIKICDEWRNNSKSFIEWSLENGYADNLTIDRIDVNGNYEPSNCRWVTNREQQQNKRNTRKTVIYGKEYKTDEIEKIFKIKSVTFYARIDRYGMTPEQAICKKDFRNSKNVKQVSEPKTNNDML